MKEGSKRGGDPDVKTFDRGSLAMYSSSIKIFQTTFLCFSYFCAHAFSSTCFFFFFLSFLFPSASSQTNAVARCFLQNYETCHPHLAKWVRKTGILRVEEVAYFKCIHLNFEILFWHFTFPPLIYPPSFTLFSFSSFILWHYFPRAPKLLDYFYKNVTLRINVVK